MTPETVLELLRAQGYECVCLAVVHKTESLAGFVWLREDYPEENRRTLLQQELDGTWVGEVRLDKKLL
jgi:hypothetical protein